MSRRMEASSSRCMATPTWGIKEKIERDWAPTDCVPEMQKGEGNRADNEDNGQRQPGRVFFKCPRNVPGMKTYFMMLVQLKYVVIDLEAGLDREEGEEAGAWGFGHGEKAESQLALDVGRKPNTLYIEMKLDALLSMLKMLIVAFFCSLVGIMYVVFK